MRTTVDKPGRAVIPPTIRRAAGLTPSTELEVQLDELSVRLVPTVPGPKIVQGGNRLLAWPTVSPEEPPEVAVRCLVEQERSRWP